MDPLHRLRPDSLVLYRSASASASSDDKSSTAVGMQLATPKLAVIILLIGDLV